MKIVHFETNATAGVVYAVPLAQAWDQPRTPWGFQSPVLSPAAMAAKGAPVWEEYASRTGLTRGYALPEKWAGLKILPARRDWRDAIECALKKGACVHLPRVHLAEWAADEQPEPATAEVVDRPALIARADRLARKLAVPTIRDWWLITSPTLKYWVEDMPHPPRVAVEQIADERVRPARAAQIEWRAIRRFARRIWRSRMERWVFEVGSGLWAVVDNPQDPKERAILADRLEYVAFLANFGEVDADFERLIEAVRKDI